MEMTTPSGRAASGPARAALVLNYYLRFTNLMQAGEGASSNWPVAVKWPVCGSILKITRLLEFWLAAIRKAPPGAISKLRGFLPPVGTNSKKWGMPVAGSRAKTAMLSWPRFEP